jgi:glycosyltransferase involved in cell wall biosynthesis
MPDAITLSVVCSMRNSAHCVAGFLESYRKERLPGTELVIVDGASTDGTLDILRSYRDVIDALVSEPDSGIYDAWNKAVRLCKGRYVSFIGSDDLIADGALAHLLAACAEHEGRPELIAGYVILTRGGRPVALWGGPYDAQALPRRMMTAQILSAHRLDWLRAAGGFDASYRSSGDYELLLRERGHLRVVVIDKILAYMEDGGMSRNSLRPFFENYRARKSNGIPAWLCQALLLKALTGVAARALGLKR